MDGSQAEGHGRSKERRLFWSERNKRGPKAEPLPFETLRLLVFQVWDDLDAKDYFQEAFGYDCVDEDEPVVGTLGWAPSAQIFKRLRRTDMWPYRTNIEIYEPDALFDMIEFLYDVVSKPETGRQHTYNNCGWHYETFSKEPGQEHYRDEINEILAEGIPPAILRENGHIGLVQPDGYAKLLAAPVPDGADPTVKARLASAIERYETTRSYDDVRHAIVDLAGVLEVLRPIAKAHLTSSDERALFNIANNFGIRHLNDDQKLEYPGEWLSWIFYVYLATAHLLLRVIERERVENASAS